MNRQEYMFDLNRHLSSVPQHEKEDIINFYEEYTADMEEKNNGNLDALESPSQVAAQIKADLAMKSFQTKGVQKKKGFSAVWAVLLGILALPMAVPLAIVVVALVFTLVVVVMSIMFSLLAVVVSVIFTALTAVVSGVILIPTSPPVALFYIGIGLIGLGIGYIAAVGSYYLVKTMFIWIAKLINKIRISIQNRQEKKKEVKYNA